MLISKTDRLSTNDIIMCYVDIRFAQNTAQTLIGGELETTPAFINVSAGGRCRANKLTARWTDLSLDVSLVISCSCEWANQAYLPHTVLICSSMS